MSQINRVEQLSHVQKEALEIYQQKRAYFDSETKINSLISCNEKLTRYIKISNDAIILKETLSIRQHLISLHIFSGLSIGNLNEIQTEAKELFKKKNSDYGDAFAKYGVIGVLVRLNDKIMRLQNLHISQKKASVLDESIRDTIIDIHNYALMAVILF